MKKSLSKYESETIISYNDESDTATIYTCNYRLIDKLIAMTKQSSDIKLIKEDEYSKTFVCPKKWVKIKMPRIISEEERQIMKERGKAMYEKYLKNK